MYIYQNACTIKHKNVYKKDAGTYNAFIHEGIMKRFIAGLTIISLLLSIPILIRSKNTLAACATNSANLGTATGSFTIPTAGTYRVWSRIKPNSTTLSNNSYTLEVDNGSVAAGSATCNITVGDASIPANTWTWVDYKDGNATSKINMTLTAGTHTYALFGRESGVGIDRVVFSADSTCVPTGNGDNCANSTFPQNPPADTTPPVITFAFPNISGIPNSGVVTSVATIVFQSSATDASNIKTLTHTLNGQPITLTSGSYTTPSPTLNDDYVFSSTAVDDSTANNTSTLAQTIKLRYPDINRDGKVSTIDVLTVLRQFNSTTLKGYDFNVDGVISTYDVLFVLRRWAP